MYTLREEEHSLHKFPDVDNIYHAINGDELTVGDMHGNALKLLYILLKHGIISNIDEEDYTKLSEIYYKPSSELKQSDLNDFNDLLKKMRFKSTLKLRLLGDELADRGSNDYFTLLILDSLISHYIDTEILFSNHTAEFFHNLETLNFSKHSFGDDSFANSMLNIQTLINNNLIKKEEVLAYIKKIYTRRLKAISYTIEDDRILLYSHAPIGINNIQSAAKYFKVEYTDSSPMELAKTIDRINFEFQKKLNEPDGISCLLQSKEINFLIWNRSYKKLLRPEIYNGYPIGFVHGHDSKDPLASNTMKSSNIINLDSNFGKSSKGNGNYSFLFFVKNFQERYSLFSPSKDQEMSLEPNDYGTTYGTHYREDDESECGNLGPYKRQKI